MPRVVSLILILSSLLNGATYYIRKTGNDACNGTSPAIAASGTCAWLTIAHAIATVSASDKVYVGAGRYRETNLTIPASTTWTADVLGRWAYDQGPVIITSYTTSDTAAPASTQTLNVTASGVTMDGFIIVGGKAGAQGSTLYLGNSTNPANLVFRRMIFLSGTGLIDGVTGTFSTGGLNILFDRCVFSGGVPAVRFNLLKAAAVDYSLGATIQNSIWINSSADWLEPIGQVNGANAFFGGGAKLYNNTHIQSVDAQGINLTLASTTFPSTSQNSYMEMGSGSNHPFIATSLGMVTENYDWITSVSPYSNVTQGANSVVSPNFSSLVDYGRQILYPSNFRCALQLAPLSGSPLISAGLSTGAPTIDITGSARPATPSVGALEVHSKCSLITQ